MEERKLIAGNAVGTIQHKKLTIIGEQEEEFKCEDSELDNGVAANQQKDAMIDTEATRLKVNSDDIKNLEVADDNSPDQVYTKK